MFTAESIAAAERIVSDRQPDLDLVTADLGVKMQAQVSAEESVEQATIGQNEAEQTLRLAWAELNAAKQDVSDVRKILGARNHSTAVAIIADPEINPAAKAIYAGTYTNRYFSPGECREIARDALAAFMTLEGRLVPGEPTLVIGESDEPWATALTVSDHTLRVTEPILTDDGIGIQTQGAISLSLSGAVETSFTHDRLVEVRAADETSGHDELLFGTQDHRSIYSPGELQAAARNDTSLIVGRSAIETVASAWDDNRKLLALVALRAIGLEASIAVEDTTTQSVTANLVSSLAQLSTEGLEITGNDDVQDSSLSDLEGLDGVSIRAVVGALGVGEAELKLAIADELAKTFRRAPVSPSQLQKNAQAMANLDLILEAIFGDS